MKIKYIYIFLLPAALSLFLFSAFLGNGGDEGGKRNDKVIKFSHSVHSEVATCEECHSAVKESTSLKDRLFPNHDNCKNCHDVDNADQCNTCHYDDNYEPLVKTTGNLIFNHRFHTAGQKLECTKCHKGISEVDYSFQAVQPNPVMADCYTCHNDRTAASNACESCHISTADLIPADHMTVDFRKTHKFEARSFDADCVMCHDVSNNSCESCHAANNIMTGTDQPYAPNNFVDDSRIQKVTRAHEPNYRFFHGIDARSKKNECQSCHETEIFCAGCHQSEGTDFAMAGIVPASHLKPGFVSPGGGEHGTLARRDIENCIACHDVQGNDPVCLNCHTDADGIKGTNPRTHAPGFMKDGKGDWHDSQGSVCYNCHLNASPLTGAGNGFCGYCHGSN